MSRTNNDKRSTCFVLNKKGIESCSILKIHNLLPDNVYKLSTISGAPKILLVCKTKSKILKEYDRNINRSPHTELFNFFGIVCIDVLSVGIDI